MTALSVRGLTYTYPNGHQALQGISFELAAGECAALIGPNGAGKSTLLLHLNGLLQGAGEIEVGQLLLRADTLKEVRRQVGLVFQDPDDQLFMPTVMEDVAFGPLNLGLAWPQAQARGLEALAQVGMQEAANQAPQHLSVGQRKRVAIATVLAMDPALLALDEPTAGLDPRARRQLIGLLRSLPQTRLIATHDLELVAELCSRVIVLDEGIVVQQGEAMTILGDAPLLEAHGLEQPLSLRLRTAAASG